jgi:hypothetical protein
MQTKQRSSSKQAAQQLQKNVIIARKLSSGKLAQQIQETAVNGFLYIRIVRSIYLHMLNLSYKAGSIAAAGVV